MTHNPALEKLGFKPDDRVAILHVDDVGMCGASLAAFDELWAKSAVTCGSVMVPCPWFRATAEWARAHPDADLGVHATLTSEWPGYRWGPVSTRDPASGLMDDEGAFPQTSPEIMESAAPEAAELELARQVELALEAGIAATHFDTHMGSVMDRRLYPLFLEVAHRHGLAPFALRLTAEQWGRAGYPEETVQVLTRETARLEEAGIPLLDRIHQLSLSDEEDRLPKTKAMIDTIRPGHIGYVVFHPAHDTPEIRSICPDWRSRVMDHEMLVSGAIREHAEAQGINLVGTRALQNAMAES